MEEFHLISCEFLIRDIIKAVEDKRRSKNEITMSIKVD